MGADKLFLIFAWVLFIFDVPPKHTHTKKQKSDLPKKFSEGRDNCAPVLHGVHQRERFVKKKSDFLIFI